MNEPAAPLSDLYRDLVLEHKRAPRHWGTLAHPTHQSHGHSPQCGDDLTLQLQVHAGRIEDLRTHGQGCAICVASASMMSEAVVGQSVAHALALHEHFRAVLTGQREPEEATLGKLVSLAGVRRSPNRIKCALLAWHALAHALGEGTVEGNLVGPVEGAVDRGASPASPKPAPSAAAAPADPPAAAPAHGDAVAADARTRDEAAA